MAIYVDNAKLPRLGMIVCHMIADTREELFAMSDRLGIQRNWLQKPGTISECFHLCLSRRALAVQLGAIELSEAQLRRRQRARNPLTNPAPREETELR